MRASSLLEEQMCLGFSGTRGSAASTTTSAGRSTATPAERTASTSAGATAATHRGTRRTSAGRRRLPHTRIGGSGRRCFLHAGAGRLARVLHFGTRGRTAVDLCGLGLAAGSPIGDVLARRRPRRTILPGRRLPLGHLLLRRSRLHRAIPLGIAARPYLLGRRRGRTNDPSASL